MKKYLIYCVIFTAFLVSSLPLSSFGQTKEKDIEIEQISQLSQKFLRDLLIKHNFKLSRSYFANNLVGCFNDVESGDFKDRKKFESDLFLSIKGFKKKLGKQLTLSKIIKANPIEDEDFVHEEHSSHLLFSIQKVKISTNKFCSIEDGKLSEKSIDEKNMYLISFSIKKKMFANGFFYFVYAKENNVWKIITFGVDSP